MHKNSLRKGFTLIETLVAISVLVVAIAAPMTVASRGLQSSYYARDQLIAIYLAQEGIELIRRKRDDFALQNSVTPSGANWYDSANSPPPGTLNDYCKEDVDAGHGCGIDARSPGLFKNCDSGSSCQLYYDASVQSGEVGSYTYDSQGGTNKLSPFTREIHVFAQSGNPSEMIVKVVVSWRSSLLGGQPKQYIVEDRLFNHYGTSVP